MPYYDLEKNRVSLVKSFGLFFLFYVTIVAGIVIMFLFSIFNFFVNKDHPKRSILFNSLILGIFAYLWLPLVFVWGFLIILEIRSQKAQ